MSSSSKRFPDARSYFVYWWGEPVWQTTLVKEGMAVEVLKWQLGEHEETSVYATAGFSDAPMPGRRVDHRQEFLIDLEPDAPTVPDMLVDLVAQAYQAGNPVEARHTLRYGDAVGPGFSGFVVHHVVEGSIEPVVLADGRHLEFLTAVPLFSAELDHVREHGVKSLFDAMYAQGIEPVDPRRNAAL